MTDLKKRRVTHLGPWGRLLRDTVNPCMRRPRRAEIRVKMSTWWDFMRRSHLHHQHAVKMKAPLSTSSSSHEFIDKTMQLLRNVSFNCVGVVVFQPQSFSLVAVWVDVVVWCGEAGYDWAGLVLLLFTYRDYLALAGWWTAVWLWGVVNRVNKHKTASHRLQSFWVDMCWSWSCVFCYGMYCMCLVRVNICVCLSLPCTGSDHFVGLCRPGYLCLLASVSNGIICILWLLPAPCDCGARGGRGTGLCEGRNLVWTLHPTGAIGLWTLEPGGW